MLDQSLLQQTRLAIRSGDDARAITLIDSDPEQITIITPFGSWLHVAAVYGRMSVVQHLLRKGADVNVRAGTFGGSPINEAASKGHLEVVNLLLRSGADLDTSDPQRNPLFSAIYGGHLEVVKLLLMHGIDSSVKYNGNHMNDMDAFAFARERGQKEIASLLEMRH